VHVKAVRVLVKVGCKSACEGRKNACEGHKSACEGRKSACEGRTSACEGHKSACEGSKNGKTLLILLRLAKFLVSLFALLRSCLD
jgi:hypothetical protein